MAVALVALLATPSGSGAGSKRFDRHGISFPYPAAWFVTTQAPQQRAQPGYRFAVSTTRVRRTPEDSGPCLPGVVDSSLCGFGRGARWIPFKDSGRAFYLGLYVGPGAPAARERALQRLVDGMRIDPPR